MVLPITLTIAGAAALINIWLMIRVGQVRSSEKVDVGDGGNEKVIRRMRAHANFGESAPIVLILIAAIEWSSGSPIWLWIVGGLYMVGRLAHGLGMDGGALGKGRMIGTILTMLIMLGLGGWAIAIPYMTPAG
ncbi:MAG: MAPEG family protein [Parasphingorhabdus sp.]|uniref:MAPEG family protein n=1 Tax=Parasphingorhabdus sp. TaxID=2709688 RepID=UPI003298F44E